ncbi:hypothetical protein SCLCIDRAFT_12378, partial [Scleroderma citrinum Foug A]
MSRDVQPASGKVNQFFRMSRDIQTASGQVDQLFRLSKHFQTSRECFRQVEGKWISSLDCPNTFRQTENRQMVEGGLVSSLEHPNMDRQAENRKLVNFSDSPDTFSQAKGQLTAQSRHFQTGRGEVGSPLDCSDTARQLKGQRGGAPGLCTVQKPPDRQRDSSSQAEVRQKRSAPDLSTVQRPPDRQTGNSSSQAEGQTRYFQSGRGEVHQRVSLLFRDLQTGRQKKPPDRQMTLPDRQKGSAPDLFTGQRLPSRQVNTSSWVESKLVSFLEYPNTDRQAE